MSTATIQLRAESRQIRTATDDLKALERQGSATDRTAQILTRTLGALGAALSVREVIGYADAYTNVQNRLSVVTESAEDLIRVQGALLDISNRTRTAFEASAILYSRTARAVEELGISESRLLRIIETVNKSFSISGATTVEAENAIRQLSQGLAAGALRGEEFNSVAEQAPEILRAVAKETGMAIGQLREFAATGGITADLLIRALENYGDVVDELFDKSARTFGQSLTVARNNAIEFTGSLESSAGVVGALGDGIVLLSGNLERLANIGGVIAAVYGARVVGAMVASTKAKADEIATTAILERAENARSVANAQRAARQAAATQAEIALNARRLQSSVAALEAERAQELVRMRAQISTIGRVQSASRLAEIELARTAIVRQLTVAESQLVAATTAATAANARLTAATATVTVGMQAKAIAVRAASASLALLGGPAGILFLAAAGFTAYALSARGAKDETEALTASVEKMTKAQAAAATYQINDRLADLQDEADKARRKIELLSDAYQASVTLGADQEATKRAYDEQVAALERTQAEIDRLNARLGQLKIVSSGAAGEIDRLVSGSLFGFTEAAKDAGDGAGELNRNFEQLSQSLQQQIIELRDGRQAAEDYAIAQRLGADATEAQRQAIAGQVSELRALQAAQEAQSRVDSLRQGIGRDIQSGMSPLQQLEAELYQRQQIIERFRQEGALSDAEARQSEIDAITAFETRKRQLYQETALQQQESLNLINWESFENRAAGALSMVATGAMSGREAIQGLAMSIVQEGIGALIKMGIQYVTTTAMQTAAATAATATTTAAAVASGAAITAAMAPAAAATSIATAGAAPAAAAPIALSTIGAIIAGLVGGAVLAGKRRQGGQVTRGNSYLVGEQGPEMITMGGNGRVTPFNQLMQKAESGGGGNSQVNLMVNISKQEGAQDSVTGRQVQDKYILDVVVGSMDSRGAVFNSVVRNTTAQGRTR